jgi:uncharacterized protein
MVYLFIILFVLALAAAVLIFHMYKEAHADRIVSHQLSFPDLPAGFDALTIFFISDIHRRTVSPDIIAKVRKKADVVIIGGDLAEKGVKLEQVRENLVRLASIAPAYFVWGNNDYELDRQKVKEMMDEIGVVILDNSWKSLSADQGDRLTLAGVDDFAIGNASPDEALEGAEPSFRILVSHNPEVAYMLDEEHKVSLVLSGHTHGGQIRILGYSPYKKGGIRKLGKTTLLVSNGYGTTALPLRLGAEAQSHLIVLRKE